MNLKIKKRTIIAFIITCIVVFATNKIWLVFHPFPVDIQLEGKGKYNSIVYLSKKDNDTFKSHKSTLATINLDENSAFHYDINRAKVVKRFKLTINDVYARDKFLLKEIKLYNDVLNLKKDDFTISGATVKETKDGFELIPNDCIIDIVYNKSLKLYPQIDFELSLLIIIIVLTFLLAYKLTDYIADFKTVKDKSRIDIIFLTVFFFCLVIPMSKINTNEISTDENRTLAKFKPLISDGAFNYNFGNDFNAWFNDRFNMRSRFIDWYDNRLLLCKYWITKKVVKGKDGWLFYGTPEALDSYTNNNYFTDEDLEKIKSYLSKIQKYCEENGKNFYFVIPPDKPKVYGEFYNDKITQVNPTGRAEQLTEYLNKQNIKTIYLKDTLVKNKDKGNLYYRHDTHWTSFGSYFGYLDIINLLKKDFKNLEVYKNPTYKESFNASDLNNSLPKILRVEENIDYKLVDTSKGNTTCKLDGKNVKSMEICTTPNKNLKVLVFRDSFMGFVIPYLSISFKESKYVWQYDVNPSLMKDADIIILEVLERFLPLLTKMEEE